MPEYYSLLVQKIREAEADPGKLRELVYEAARLALKRHVNVHYPALSLHDGKRLLADLEVAIERLEADETGAVSRPVPEGDKLGPFFAPSRNGGLPEAILQEAEHQRHAGPAIPPSPPQAGAELLDWPPAGSNKEPEAHDLFPAPNQPAPANRGAVYAASPNSYPSTSDDWWRSQAKLHPASRRKILIAVAIASHVAVGVLAGAAFYITMTGRAAQPPGIVEDFAVSPPQRPTKSLTAKRSNASPSPTAEPLTTASFAGTTPTAASAAMASRPVVPRPAAYGVYAISNNRLIELEQILPTPVDPRVRNGFQIVKPARTVINDARLSFIAYRRDLSTTAPERVSVRIAARIARAMTVDPLGKAVMEPPPTESWLIREFGYDLRVSPISESSEMVMLRPEDEEFAFPSGRYELVLGGQAYDFLIAGIITDPAQCVESVTTPRGPAFYDCRTP